MATFVCALCLKDIHGEPTWVNPPADSDMDAGPMDDSSAACAASNLPEHAPYHPACAERAFPDRRRIAI